MGVFEIYRNPFLHVRCPSVALASYLSIRTGLVRCEGVVVLQKNASACSFKDDVGRLTHPIFLNGHTLQVLPLDREAKETNSEVQCEFQHLYSADSQSKYPPWLISRLIRTVIQYRRTEGEFDTVKF